MPLWWWSTPEYPPLRPPFLITSVGSDSIFYHCCPVCFAHSQCTLAFLADYNLPARDQQMRTIPPKAAVTTKRKTERKEERNGRRKSFRSQSLLPPALHCEVSPGVFSSHSDSRCRAACDVLSPPEPFPGFPAPLQHGRRHKGARLPSHTNWVSCWLWGTRGFLSFSLSQTHNSTYTHSQLRRHTSVVCLHWHQLIFGIRNLS